LRFSIKQLHPFSGMDGGEMLNILLRDNKAIDLKKEILKKQGQRYREKFLASVAPFPGIRGLFENIKQRGWRIGLATSCQPDELRHYDSIVNVCDLADAIACGQDVKRGKPYPDLHEAALQRLGTRGPQAVSVGDTPFDAIAASKAGIARIVGTLTGGFSEVTLRAAGCGLVLNQTTDFLERIGLEESLQCE
jgi:phosphoglycolate phosphatase-like HAD superfamily hydrolase